MATRRAVPRYDQGMYDPTAPEVDTPQGWNPALEPDLQGTEVPGYLAEGGTDGIAPLPEPERAPSTDFGVAPAGWEQSKWSDPNHTSPKYLIGRALTSVGDLTNPENRARAIAEIQRLLPGTTFDGKDAIMLPGGTRPVDIFKNASKGEWIPQFSPVGSRDGGGSDGHDDPHGVMSQFASQYAGGSGGGSYGGGGGGGGFDVKAILAQLMGQGAGDLNKDIMGRRLDSAKGSLARQRRSMQGNTDAALAERGLIGSGPEATALFKNNTDFLDMENEAYSNIFADEAERADARLIEALALATGMTMDEARLAVQSQLGNRGLDVQSQLGNRGLDVEQMLGVLGNQTTRRGQDITSLLGQGNLALGNLNANMDWNRFMAQHGLDRDRFGYEQGNQGFNQMIQLLDLYMRGAGTAAAGRV